MAASLRAGLIGCGEYCNKTHAPRLMAHPAVEIVGVCECVYPGELSQRQRRWAIPAGFSTVEQLLDNLELDVVVVSTPHQLHYAQVMAALERGVHVLVDKPPACTAQDARQMAQFAAAAGLLVAVACPKRYHPAYRRMAEALRQGDLGELTHMEVLYRRSRSANFADTWRNDPALSGGGVLIDAGYHYLDLILWYLKAEITHLRGSLDYDKTAVETAADLELEFSGGVSAHIVIDLGAREQTVQEHFSLQGTQGSMTYHRQKGGQLRPESYLELVAKSQQGRQDIVHDDQPDFAPVDNLLAALCSNAVLLSPVSESIAPLDAIQTIYGISQKDGVLGDFGG